MAAPRIHWISAEDPPDAFPDIDAALEEPNGLLAAGGDLSDARLLAAYRRGIFPWYEEGQPVLWWSPRPRCIIRPSRLHLSRRTERALRGSGYTVTFNRQFRSVVERCAAPREAQAGTWITDDMMTAYDRLHRRGWAHSVEILSGGALVGGLYGIAIGRVFFGESMFSDGRDGSKAALLALCRQLTAHDCPLLDCQVESGHLLSLGAELIERERFLATLDDACEPQRPMTFLPSAPQPIEALL